MMVYYFPVNEGINPESVLGHAGFFPRTLML
jgi:hypothetical protein